MVATEVRVLQRMIEQVLLPNDGGVLTTHALLDRSQQIRRQLGALQDRQLTVGDCFVLLALDRYVQTILKNDHSISKLQTDCIWPPTIDVRTSVHQTCEWVGRAITSRVNRSPDVSNELLHTFGV